jgi:hypothetical protein
MVLAWTAVKTHFFNTRLEGLLCNRLTNDGSRGFVAPGLHQLAHIHIQGAYRHKRPTANVVDHLAADLPETTMHAKPWPFDGAANSVAHMKAPPFPPPIYDHLLLHGSTQASEMLSKGLFSTHASRRTVHVNDTTSLPCPA